MDANQTRFHLVFGKAGWLAGGSDPGASNVEWRPEDATLHLRRLPFVFPGRRGDSPVSAEQRRGAGRDRYGNWYWIGAGRDEILFRSHEGGAAEHFWSRADLGRGCPTEEDATFKACVPVPVWPELSLSGLAVTEDHYLLVGLESPAGLLVFDLHGGGAPQTLLWPSDVAFAPFDIAPSPDGGAWILDRRNARLWGLDRRLQVIAAKTALVTAEPDFQVAGADPGSKADCAPEAPIRAEMAFALEAFDPIAVDTLPDGSLLVLDRDGERSLVHHVGRTGEISETISLDEELQRWTQAAESEEAGRFAAQDLAFVPARSAQDQRLGMLYVVGTNGNQAFAFVVNTEPGFSLTLEPQYFPMRLYGGRALVRGAQRAYYDSAGQWRPLVEQPRPSFAREAQLLLPPASDGDEAAFDGKEPGCIWHRLLLDACIPAEGSVLVESRAADTHADLDLAPWQAEPRPYLRSDGSEIPFRKRMVGGPSDRAGTWELLFQQASGRFLQIRLTLAGSGRSTAKLQALRIYYPRFSYLQNYLPAVYQDDPTSASFVDRFLANLEGLYTALEGRIEHVQELFDADTAPAEYLEWLAAWMGATLDLTWSESTRRLFLRHAEQLFRERGTRTGLIRALRLSLEECPSEDIFDGTADSCCATAVARRPTSVRIVERFLLRRAPGVVFGDPSDVLGPGSTTDASVWNPALGTQPLHEAYRRSLRARYESVEALNTAWQRDYVSFDGVELPPVRPPNRVEAADWEAFLRGDLGFTYAAANEQDAPLFRAFLARTYRNLLDLRQAYGAVANSWSSFGTIPLPSALPPGGPPLRDWIIFVSLIVPTERNAHRFTVLVPVMLGEDRAVAQRRLDIAQRITLLQKPAHTQFDAKLYWAAFRVGEARLGIETALGESSRFTALVLGRDALGAASLGYAPDWIAPGRWVVGRERITDEPRSHGDQERTT